MKGCKISSSDGDDPLQGIGPFHDCRLACTQILTMTACTSLYTCSLQEAGKEATSLRRLPHAVPIWQHRLGGRWPRRAARLCPCPPSSPATCVASRVPSSPSLLPVTQTTAGKLKLVSPISEDYSQVLASTLFPAKT